MTVPNPALMSAYGTGRFFLSNLEKRAAELPSALALGAPLTTLALWGVDRAHIKRQLTEAAILNQMFREAEAERQSSVIAGLRGGSAMSPHGQAAQQLNQMAAYQAMLGLMSKYSSAGWSEEFGRTLAHKIASLGDAGEMDKEAIGAPLIGGIAKGVGALLRGGGATARLTQAAVRGGAATAPMVSRAMTPASARAFQAVGRGVQGIGQGAQRMTQAVGTRARGLVSPAQGLGAGSARATAPRAPAAPRTVPAAHAPTPAATAAPAAATAAPVAAPAAVATPAGQARPSLLSKTWEAVRPGWKTKALAGGAVLGTGYVGYKGLQTARDYMMQPTYASQAWGGYGMAPPSSVGPYGYSPWAT